MINDGPDGWDCEDLEALKSPPARNPWKDAIIDALITIWAYREHHEEDPKKAVHDLITAEVNWAMDPVISKSMYLKLLVAFQSGVEWGVKNASDASGSEEAFEEFLEGLHP